ncbi:hypothetical protein F9802_02475 [Bacillus aerolatus]|uniref:Uncharacterized protein n=1 Tax=Bacillus aerolatus TaxID=2653354 RepID=A0A6I1FJX6_9BACI|nr:hypothetical protein [Bacillus aerolatus]KAB7709019.1 hypothetical protein F9802_02475 [Bacillus aerolatus]
MEKYLRRVAAYCPDIDSMVNQEISFTEINGQKEFSATCTAIRESCHDCFIVKITNNGCASKTELAQQG